jgi:ribonuclease G
LHLPEWLIEAGIGESRAILLDGAQIIAARIDLPGELAAGQIAEAVLISRTTGSPRGTARFANGQQALVDRLPPQASEGAELRLEVTRAAIQERGRMKLAQARPSAATPCPAPSPPGRVVHSFPDCDWDELWDEAADGMVTFPGGALHFALTPALTVIDIDGDLNGRDLALAAVTPLATALQRFDLGGSIGIDFPTLAAKADRRAVDEALAAALAGWPHERTAMNGFGFVQLVSRLTRPSLLHRVQLDRANAIARRLLRRAERVREPGALLLSCHPAIKAALREDWIAELARRSGREVRIETDPQPSLASAFAQAVPI